MSKKWKRRLGFYGWGLVFIALFMIALRSFVVEFFENAKYRSFMAPAGKMFAHNQQMFSFAAVSDTGARNEPIERILKNIRHSKAKFVLYVGDLVRYRNPSHFKWIADEIDAKLGHLPLYAVPGNHEIYSVNGKVDKSLYNELFGQGYYWFSYGDVLFIGLDSSTSSYDDEQLHWLEKTLTKIRPQFKFCVIFSHVPPINVRAPNTHRFAKIIMGKNVNLLISGHVHHFSESEFAGVPLVTLPSSGQPIRSEIRKFGYVEFEFGPKGIRKVKPIYVISDDDMEHFEAFMSNALVDKMINSVAVWLLGIGGVLIVLNIWLRRRKKK